MGGSQYLKSPGSFGKLVKKERLYSWVKMKSGFYVKISNLCFVTIGSVKTIHYNVRIYRKAGYVRFKLNRRPQVRGVAKNPVDHPHGGGEGKKSGKSISMSPWGKLIKGRQTVKDKSYLYAI